MANPLYNTHGSRQNGGLDVNLLKSEAMKLRQSLQQHPRQIVEQMVRSGQIPQAELNRVFPMATELSQIFR